MLIRRGGGAFLHGGGFFRLTIWGICIGIENAPPVSVPTARGGLVLDVGVGDVVGFGVVLDVGVREDAEGKGGTVGKGFFTDSIDVAEVAQRFESGATIECATSNERNFVQAAYACK